MNLRAVTLAPDTPMWVKVLPLVFVLLIGYGLITGEHKQREAPPADVTSQVRPH